MVDARVQLRVFLTARVALKGDVIGKADVICRGQPRQLLNISGLIRYGYFMNTNQD